MEILLEIILRCALGFGTLLFITRMIGNKQLGQMNIFTYISGIAIGAMAGGMVIYHEIEIIESFLGILLWGIFTIVLERIALRSRKIRRVLNGQPVIVISSGRILYDKLKKERLSLDDLSMLLRMNQVFTIEDVDYAILETNGELSILKKATRDTVTKQDMGIPTQPPIHLPIQVIAEGQIITNNLELCGKTQEWLISKINLESNQEIKDILYAELQGNDKLMIQQKNS